MKIKLIICFVCFGMLSYGQITKAEAFLTGTKLAFYPNQCGNSIPEATGKLTFCDGANNLGIVERSYGLNDRGVERMLSNYFNEDEFYVTRNGLSVRNTDGTWENIPNIAIPTFNGQNEWTNNAAIQNGLVLPNGKVIIQATNAGVLLNVYDRNLKTITPINFPNNKHPQLVVYDPDRELTWVLAFGGNTTYLFTYDNLNDTLTEISSLGNISVFGNSVHLIHNEDDIYLGNNSGLYKIDISDYTNAVPVALYNTETSPSLPFDRVSDLQFDANGNLWLAQSGNGDGGIVKLDTDLEAYELYQLERENNPTLNHAFEALALDNLGTLWATANSSSSLYKLTFPANTETWDTTTYADLETLGVPVTYVPSELYHKNNQFYFGTSDFSSGSNNNFEVIINNNDVWSGRSDNEEGNLSERMNRRFTGNMPDANGGVWWFNGYDDIVVYRDSDDNHQSILLDNTAFYGVVDTDNKAVVRAGSPSQLRKIDFPNTISIQDGVNQATDIKRVADQIWVFDHTNKKIDAYKNDLLVHTYDLDEDWYQLVYDFAVDDDGNAWFMRNGSGSLIIKKFDISTLTTTTYDDEVPDVSLSTLRKVVSAPNGGVWFMGTLGVVYQENGVFYDFLAVDYPEIYNLRDLIVDTNGKAYLLNNDGASIATIENPTAASPIIEDIDIEGTDSVLPSLDHYRPDALAIDSEGSIWTHASLNTFKLIDDDFATEYIPQPEVLSVLNVTLDSDIRVYPIPAQETINVTSTVPLDNLELYDLLGKRVLEIKSTQRLNVDGLDSGLYILKITIGSSTKTQKVVIE